MKLVLTHVNSRLPNYIWYNFENMRIWNPDLDIKIICHEQYQTDADIKQLKKYNVELVPCEELNNKKLEEFLELSWYEVWGTPDTNYPSPPKFVQGTSERLYVLNAYLQETGDQDIFHIENDVMIYEDLNKLLPICQKCYSKMAITPMANLDHTFAFVYIPKPDELNRFCDYNNYMLFKGNDYLMNTYKLDMVHEMSIVKIYKDEHDGVDFFPILPYGEYSTNYEEFNSLFDPASWGQYVGGTNGKGNTIGYAGNHHIIGREILTGKCTASFNGKYPVVNNDIKLNCLHVHSKRLEKYITC